MSYHHTHTPEWRNDNNTNSNATAISPATAYSSQHTQPQTQQSPDDDNQQYPVGVPLSYFPTHHQPLSQQEYDEEQLQRLSQYHQISPLEHAQSPLSSRTPEWGGGGYSGHDKFQGGTANPNPNDIPLVGIDIISSNLEAARGNQYSDTRTPDNMQSTPPQSNEQRSVYNAGAGVGTNDGSQYNPYQQQQQQQNYESKPLGEGSQAQQPVPEEIHMYSDGTPVPKVLLDPKVNKQLQARRTWKPWFIWLVSLIQIAVLVFELVKGYQRTGQVIQTQPFNPMIGPGTGTIINVGARFVPCMRSTYLDSMQIKCPDNETLICSISDICGFTPIQSTGKPPNQWFRFITPIFLHGGIVHLLFNLAFQLRTGADLERDMGWWRIGIIYMCSGIVGFIFGGNFAPLLSPSMGASGAIFGLIGCLVLDLIQNWKLVVRPCWELTKLSLMILFSFAFGLLPFLDNFAHIGGFFAGILSGLVFMPVIYFSKRDRIIKTALRVIALPLIVLIIVLGLNNFYKGANNCSWCRYLSCLPINGWCDAFDTPVANTTGP